MEICEDHQLKVVTVFVLQVSYNPIVQGDWVSGSNLSRRLQGVQTTGARNCAGGKLHFHLYKNCKPTSGVRAEQQN